MKIVIRGELEGFLVGWQDRLRSLVRGHLQRAALPVESVEVLVSRTESGEITCRLTAGFSIGCELVVRETGVFLASPVEAACLRVRGALAEISRKTLTELTRAVESSPVARPDLATETSG